MPWNRWYSSRSYIRSSLWIVPFVALLLDIAVVRAANWIDAVIPGLPSWPWSLSGTQMMLQTVITLTLTFIVFTFASLLVAIQVASGQLTPRIIATVLLRDNAIRATVGLFIFTLLFATGTLGRLEAEAPFVLVGLAGYPRILFGRRLSVLDRLCGAAAAPGQHSAANQRGGRCCHRERLRRPGQWPRRAGQGAQGIANTGANCYSQRQVWNYIGGKFASSDE